MKKLIISMMICATIDAPALAASAAEAAQPKDIPVTSEVREVTVYNNSARVTRVAEVDLPAGAHNVVFGGLPLTLTEDSLRVEATAGADVSLGAIVSKKLSPPVTMDTSKEQELNAKIESLDDQVNLISAEKQALDARRAFLATLGQQATLRTNAAIAQYDLKPGQWTDASQALFTGTADVLKAAVLDDQKLRDLHREIEAAKAQIAGLYVTHPQAWEADVPLESKTATHARISLSYVVSNAGWKPLYDARLDGRGKGDLTLTQYGDVRQTTGEDWNGVALTLSTTQPQRGASQQKLASMWVGMTQGASISPSRFAIDSVTTFDGGGSATTFRTMSANVMSAAKPDPQALAAAYNAQRATLAAAQVKTTKFTSEYKVPGPATVPSNGSDTKLMVGPFDGDTALEVEVKPQLGTDAYLVARTKLKGDAPILGGKVNLFRDGAFIGELTLPVLRPGEETALYFGIDDSVSVTRNTVKDERGVSGMLSQTSALERNFVTKIQNLHKSPVDVVVLETVPVTQNKDLVVDIAPDTTAGYATDVDHVQGMTKWSFNLKPDEDKEIKLGWKVTWPSDNALTGVPNM